VKTNKTSRPSSVAPPRSGGTTRVSAKAPTAALTGKHLLRLYVAGATERSRQAILRARQLCETELKGQYDLEVIDVYQQPILAREGQIVATPTLVRDFPRPVRRLIGNLANTDGLFVGLDLATKGNARP
jgi:circadian clock protein KaiB